MSDSDGIDAKALAVLGANIAILIFIDQADLKAALWEFVLLYTPFALSFLLDMFSIWPRRYAGMPDVDDTPEYLNMDRQILILQLLADTEAAIHHNVRLNRSRMRACLLSVLLTGLGFLALLFIL